MITVTLIAIASAIAYSIGKRRGAEEMEYLCRNAAQVEREFFSQVSRG
jgi:hypothetical protein